MSGTLFVVGTPIGNLGDMSRRARETLGTVDLVAAEDTRRAGRLLQAFGIRARLVSLHEANERERTEQLLTAVREGAKVAVISDGGMPGISDPGFRLVRACTDEGLDVRVVPGPSAAIAALVVSGLPTDRFTFEGFLPRKEGERAKRLGSLAHDRRTIVCFESPLRVQILLRDVLALLGDRRIALARELTKLHEEVVRGRVSEVLGTIADHELKGEVVIVIEGAAPVATDDVGSFVDEAAALSQTGVRKRDAAHEVAERHGVSANALYRALLERTPG